VKDGTDSHIKLSLFCGLIIFALICILNTPSTFSHVMGCISKAVTITVIVMALYEKWLWHRNPFVKIPKLQRQYDGRIEYCFDGTPAEKQISIQVEQTLLSTCIKIMTDEISSTSIVSTIVCENGHYILYYTYITNPKRKYSERNPIQYGTCRLELDNTMELRGTYWTSRRTIGDIYLKATN
jgi:hypothetical protein